MLDKSYELGKSKMFNNTGALLHSMHKETTYVCDVCGKSFPERRYEDNHRTALEHESIPIDEGNDGRGYHGIVLCGGEPYPRHVFFIYIPKSDGRVDMSHNRLYRLEQADTDDLAAIDLEKKNEDELLHDFGLGSGGPLSPSKRIDSYVGLGVFYVVNSEILEYINKIYSGKAIRDSPLVRESVPDDIKEWRTLESRL